MTGGALPRPEPAPDTLPDAATPDWAFRRYEAIRARLPHWPEQRLADSVQVADLGDLEADFDAFLFDSFGVLNVGDTPLPVAASRLARLKALGKQVVVLTNAATPAHGDLIAKYERMDFGLEPRQIVSSRAILAAHMAPYGSDWTWAVAAPPESGIAELPGKCLAFDAATAAQADGIVFLSSKGWSAAAQAVMAQALADRPRPFLIGNPDLVAPREGHLSLESGAYAHDLADRLGLAPEFFGKPFANAFGAALRSLPPGIPPERVLMVGDTLHTDILGAAAAGIASLLVTEHGVLQALDVDICIARSGIRPTYIASHI